MQQTSDASNPEKPGAAPRNDAVLAPPRPPLVVDLDGTLTPTDTLLESVIRALKRNPLILLRAPLWLLRGRAVFKTKIAECSEFSAEHLPLREPLVRYLEQEKAQGRRIILATAAHRRVADSVASVTGLFDGVLATDVTTNLKGRNKLLAITQSVGPRFSYAGDSASDLPIWLASESVIVVGEPAHAQTILDTKPVERHFPNPRARLGVWLKAIRVHQWLKNLLLFVPLLTSFAFTDVHSVFAICAAFLSMSFAASATYLVNDLWDLDNDRIHPRKRSRPLASAQITIGAALCVAAALLAVAIGVAALVNPAFLGMLLVYLVLTSAYSWLLKRYILMDVLMLATLYTLRILAGSLAIGVSTSSWLLAFSVFMFFSLALVKRCSELVLLAQTSRKRSVGRDYAVSDLQVLWPLGVGAGLCSVVVFGLFINSADMNARYATPQLLWLVGLVLLYWLGRLWIKTARGEMHDDPLIFALKDFGSRITITAMVGVTLAAHSLP